LFYVDFPFSVNDGICKQFAEAVKVFQDWLGSKKKALEGDKTQPLPQQLAALEASSADQQAGLCLYLLYLSFFRFSGCFLLVLFVVFCYLFINYPIRI
jgi:hypothetical protein